MFMSTILSKTIKTLSLLLSLCCFTSFQALAQADTIPQKMLERYTFRNIGPAGMSGRITAIKVAPSNEQVIYAGSASGGLWKSTNGGQSWGALFQNEAVSSVGALALDPQNPDVIYVGTGEGNPRNSLTSGYGLYQSIDGGKNWKCLGLEQTRNIHRILVHPYNPNILYVAAIGTPWGDSEHRGVYKSTDRGKSWKKILYKNERTGAAELIMDPQNPDKLMVNMWNHRRNPWFFKSGGDGSGLFVSFDGGESWQERTDKNGLPKGGLGRVGLAIAPSNTKRVYALVESKGNNAIYRSNDGGYNWKKVSEEDNIGNRPFYYAEIYVDPKNENRLFSLWTMLSMSEDAGKSWKVIAPYSSVHPDHHSFYIHPENPSYIIEGNDGGLNISRDGGKNWRFVENLPVAQFYHVNYDMDLPYNVYGGMQDNGSWKGPAYVWRRGGIRNSYWQELYFGDGFDVVPDLSDPRYVYAMSQQGYVGRIDTETGYSKLIRPVHPEAKELRYNWNAAIAQDPFEANTVYFGAQYVFKSTDKGENWDLISPDLTTNDSSKQKYGESGGLTYDVTGAETYTSILAIEPDKKEANVLWVGSDDGVLSLSRDGGKNWNSKLFSKLPGAAKGAWIPQVVASPHKAGAAFVVVNDYRRNNWKAYLYYTENYGKSFKRLASPDNIPGYVLSVVQDHLQPNLLFLGTNRGLYFSLNSGKSWQQWGKDFPTVPVTDLKIHPREGDLIAGTFGRSCQILDDLSPLRALAANKQEVLDAKVRAFDAPTAYQVRYKRADGTRFAANAIFQGDNRGQGARISFWSNITESDSIKAKKARLSIVNTDGDTIRTLYKNYKEGLNRVGWSLDGKSEAFPAKKAAIIDTTERGGLSVLPGTYKVWVRIGAYTDDVQLEVKSDPRIKYNMADQLAFHEQMRDFNKKVKVLRAASEELKRSKETLKSIKAIYKLREADSSKTAMLDSIKAVSKSLKTLEEKLYGKVVEGYYDQPNTIREQYGAARGYFDNLGGISSGGKVLLDKSIQSMEDYLKEVNAFYASEWKTFKIYVEQEKVSLFGESKTFKLE
jgi:photosystem II stability/assembly factor-like uncharacterized protein